MVYVIIIAFLVVAALWAYFALAGKKPPQVEGIKSAPEKLSEPSPAAKLEPAKRAPKPAPPKVEPAKHKAPESKAPEPKIAEDEISFDEASRDSRAPALAPRPRDVAGLRRGLARVRDKEGLFGRLKALFAGKQAIDPQVLEQMEEVLLTSDVGVQTTQALLANLKEGVDKRGLSTEGDVWNALRAQASRILSIGGGGVVLAAKPTVVMFVGVNGVGKTTTIGKLATKLKAQNKKVVLAAGDTFRAAAVQQLELWGKRVGCEVVRGKEGANPGAVIFDAIQKAKELGADVVLADTAGRLHTKTNLMEELKKVARTMDKAEAGAPHETLLVLDATNGQNAMQQAAIFKDALPLSGIVLTKLDGTAKGGVILGICAEHAIPVRYIGVGERADDLRDFVADEFVEALLGQGADSAEAAA